MAIALDGDEQHAARRGILTGQSAQFGLNLLKGEVKADPLDVFAKHLPHVGNIGINGGTDVQDFQPRTLDYSLCVVSLAELTLPMLMVAAADEPAADPELVRLVTLARTGDRAAFGRLIERHLTAARRVALAAVGQPSDADEAVQEASVAAWRRLDALNDAIAFRGWFLRIVWRKAIDRRRSLRSWFDRFSSSSGDDQQPIEFAAAGPTPDQILISRELAVAISQVVRSLPRKLRDPFLLAASGDHRYEDIASMLGTPLGTVKWRIAEARRVIRLKLDHMGHGDPR
jgi:RNA polymerase sigma-70 factor (ECF subfamily)